MDKQLIEQIALETAQEAEVLDADGECPKREGVDITEYVLDFSHRFLARIDAERGKSVVVDIIAEHQRLSAPFMVYREVCNALQAKIAAHELITNADNKLVLKLQAKVSELEKDITAYTSLAMKCAKQAVLIETCEAAMRSQNFKRITNALTDIETYKEDK